MDKKTIIFIIACFSSLGLAILYKKSVNNDIANNKITVIGKVNGIWNGKGAGTTIGYDLYYNKDTIDSYNSVNTIDSRLYEIGSCYEVEISSKNPKHCRITPKQVPCR
ncbi:MAG: hypothetical protein U0T69_13415 [Chitinophagales bacterium]